MSFKSFLIYLAVVTSLSLFVNYFLLAEATLLKDYLSSGLLGICTFVSLSIIIFLRGVKLYRQEDKSSFISWVMAATLIKLFASLVILIILQGLHNQALITLSHLSLYSIYCFLFSRQVF